jgi:ankyrin repeat protein
LKYELTQFVFSEYRQMNLSDQVRQGNDDVISSLPAEILFQIAVNLPTADIIRLCQTSQAFNQKLCQDNFFWRQLYQRDISTLRLPQPIQRLESRTQQQLGNPDYRQAYGDIVQSIDLDHPNLDQLERAIRWGYEIPVYRFFNQHPEINHRQRNDLLTDAVRAGYPDIIDFLLSHGANDYNRALIAAIRNKNPDLVQFFLRLGIDNYIDALNAAAVIGDLDLVRHFLNLLRAHQGNWLGANQLAWATFMAARENHSAVVDELVRQGADLNAALRGAAFGNHRELVQQLIDQGATDFDAAMEEAASKNHQSLIEFFMSRGANQPADLNQALVGAARGGHVDLMMFLLDHGANDVNSALVVAARRSPIHQGVSDAVDFLLDHGANNYNQALIAAAAGLGNRTPILQQMIDHGATAVNQALRAAAERGKINAIEFLIDHGATNLNAALRLVAHHGPRNAGDAIISLVRHGATSLNQALIEAASHASPNQRWIIGVLLQLGATDIPGAIRAATAHNNQSLVEFLRSRQTAASKQPIKTHQPLP